FGRCPRAPVAELVDALDSKSSSARSAGSIPARGTRAENVNKNNNLNHRFDSVFRGHLRGSLKTLVKSESSRPICRYFCWHRKIKRSRRICYSERRNRANGPQERWRGRQPKAYLIDVDCRAARPKFDIGDGPLAL